MGELIEEKNWYALYTKPRWEKKIHGQLVKKGIDSWCPLNKELRQWADRKKMVEEPLFKCYIFVNINFLKERTEVLMTDGILNFVHYLRKPAVIKSYEIDNIKGFLGQKNARIEMISTEGFEPDTKIKVSQGVFKDREGTVIRGNKKRVYVQFASLGQIMVVEFSAEHLIPLEV